jgi:myo-inositol 2-dehydrogenase / D-chiro-inositol 1-dehydrogenase
MRIAVFGAGRMAEIRIEDMVKDSRIKNISVINRSPEKAESLKSRFGIEIVSEKDFKPEGFDSYVITTGTSHHAQALDLVLGPKRKILCEKPIALELADTDAVLDRAKKAGAEIQVGFQRRFDPPIAKAKQLIDSGSVGTMYHIRFMSNDIQPSSREFLAGSGGVFRDLHVHDFDLAEWLCSEPIAEVFATRRVREYQQYAEFDDGDVSLIHAMTQSGVQISISGTRHDPRGHDVRFEVFGSKDSLSAGLSPRTPLNLLDAGIELSNSPYTGFVDRFRDAFREETKAYIEWIAGNRNNPFPPDSARSGICIAIACEISAREKRVVKVAEVRGS